MLVGLQMMLCEDIGPILHVYFWHFEQEGLFEEFPHVDLRHLHLFPQVNVGIPVEIESRSVA